jgi:lipoate-protein ligase A
MSSAVWRLIPYGTADGAMQMAIDEAILEAHLSDLVPPTLRLYGFTPAAVTVGRSQPMDESLVASIAARGIDVVRRPTGGRAVLHLNDLTYSFIGSDVSIGGVLQTSVSASYKQICQGLIGAFAELGVQSELGSAGAGYRHLKDCFMATTGSDLHHKGVKLIGSAQLRRRGGVLQHGSVPLNQDPRLMSEILNEPAAALVRHHNLFDLVGRQIQIHELQAAMLNGFTQAFGFELKIEPLKQWELDLARQRSAAYRLAAPVAAS